jgi:hypothetical protein
MNETKENPLLKILNMSRQIMTVDRLGGRDSFFGMMEIFEIILKEEHDKLGETGMYRFKGMEQYGNIVSIPQTYDAVKRCIDELKFTKEEFDKLINWYKGRDHGPDTSILALAIEWCIKDNKYFQ